MDFEVAEDGCVEDLESLIHWLAFQPFHQFLKTRPQLLKITDLFGGLLLFDLGKEHFVRVEVRRVGRDVVYGDVLLNHELFEPWL